MGPRELEYIFSLYYIRFKLVRALNHTCIQLINCLSLALYGLDGELTSTVFPLKPKTFKYGKVETLQIFHGKMPKIFVNIHINHSYKTRF